MKKLLPFLIVLATAFNASAQIGGMKSYEFLNVPQTARVSGLGGVNVSTADRDVNMFFSNPALVGESLNGQLGFNFLTYPASIYMSSVGYTYHFTDYGTLSGGVQYFALGTIDTYDASGNLTGNARSGETNVNASFSHQMGSFRMGGSIKWVNSSIAEYTSNALLFDVGGVYIHPEKDLNVGLVIKNAGFVLGEYSGTSDTQVPFDVQLGITYKPEHMPFRLSLTAHNLTKADITYYDSEGNLVVDKPGGFDKVLSHFVIGTEVVLGENVNLRLGYNHLVRESLRLNGKSGGAGITFGFMIKIKKIELAYSHGGYHVAGGLNNFTISTNIGRFMDGAKKEKP